MSSGDVSPQFSLDFLHELATSDPPANRKERGPYDEYSREGWELTEAILAERLGPYNHTNNLAYTGIYDDARYPGFQEEWPLSVWTSPKQNDALTISLVMKGIIHTQYHPLWMATQFAVVARQASQPGTHVLFERLGGITCSINERDKDWMLFFDPANTQGGREMNLGRKLRIIEMLRNIDDRINPEA